MRSLVPRNHSQDKVGFTNVLVDCKFNWQEAYRKFFPEEVKGKSLEEVRSLTHNYRRRAAVYVEEYLREAKEVLRARLIAEVGKSIDMLVDLRDNAMKLTGGREQIKVEDTTVRLKAAEDLIEYSGLISKKVEVMDSRNYADMMNKYLKATDEKTTDAEVVEKIN